MRDLRYQSKMSFTQFYGYFLLMVGIDYVDIWESNGFETMLQKRNMEQVFGMVRRSRNGEVKRLE